MISTNLHQQTMKSIIMVSYFLLLVLFINIFVVATDDDYVPVYFDSNCTITRNFTSNSPYQFTLATLFVSLSSHLDANTYFYNTTQGIQNTNDTVFVLFMCRRDVPSQLCHDCVQLAATRIGRLCPNNKEAIIWYEECMLRYSDRHFFSTLQKDPNTGFLFPKINASNVEKQVLEGTVKDVVEEAAKSKFAVKESNLTETTLYSLAQCTQDLSTQDCHDCLRDIIRRLWSRNATVYGNISGNSFILGVLFYPTCNLMFGPQRFYYKRNVTPVAPIRDVQGLRDDRQYLLNYSCSSNKSFIANSSYQSNLRNILHTLVSFSNATGNMGFYNTTVSGRNPSDTVYGLFMCRGDVSPQICHQCVSNASKLLSSECQLSKEAIVWYLSCLLRYSNNHSFFSTSDTSLKYIYTANFIHKEQNDFNQQLATTLSKLVEEATDSGLAVEGAKKFATEDVSSDTMWGMFYTLAQCTPDLSTQDCRKCLSNIVDEIKLCCLGKQAGGFMYPSCNMIFASSYRFYYKNNTISETPPAPTPTHKVSGLATKGKKEGQSRTIIIVAVVVLIVVSLILLCFAYYILGRKRSKRNKAILKENFGSESASLESLQFSLDTIEAATNHFSYENRIGKGGFGEVYKGVFSDGREIAVKRLSRSSGQGVIEFINEILLIVKLQHRNLVTLLGFCLEGQEKILVYEFVPNKSLDYFLFGSQRKRVLHWLERYKIIGGIARGILYIHEHSRLKVIHRDLKPSNILLDNEMNPKISDFGMAKMVAISETEGNTNRIVGTYGYMSPEYAMLGQFSEKLDVFSFGVIVLEIISGKRNASCHGSQHMDGLLSYAWKQWRGGNWSDILDSDLIELESYNNEVVRCIQIGLLCVQENPDARPSMNTIVQYLSNDSIQLPLPQEPAFFLHGRMEPTNGGIESRFAECAANNCSVNEMSMSNYFSPR